MDQIHPTCVIPPIFGTSPRASFFFFSEPKGHGRFRLVSPPMSSAVVICRWVRRNIRTPSNLCPPFSPACFLSLPHSLLPRCTSFMFHSVHSNIVHRMCRPSTSRFYSSAVAPHPIFPVFLAPCRHSSQSLSIAPRPPQPFPPLPSPSTLPVPAVRGKEGNVHCGKLRFTSGGEPPSQICRVSLAWCRVF